MKVFIIVLIFHAFLSCTRDETINDNEINILLNCADSEVATISDRVNCVDKAFNIVLQTKSNNSFSREILFKVANRYYNLKFFDKYKFVSEKILVNAKQSGDHEDIAKSNRYLGDYYYSFSHAYNLDSAFVYYNKAEKTYKAINDDENLLEIILRKTDILIKTKDLYSAEYSAFSALKLADSLNSQLGKFKAYTFLGVISTELHDYFKAKEFFTDAYNLVQNHQLDNNNEREISLNNIGFVFQNLGNHPVAAKIFTDALDELSATEYPQIYAVIADNLAYSNFKFGNSDPVESLFKQSIKIKDSLKLHEDLVFSTVRLSEFLMQEGDTIQALSALKNIVSRIDINNYNKLMALERLLLYNQSSINQTRQYLKTRDSIQLVERKMRNRFARIRFETEQIRNQKNLAIKDKWIIAAVASTVILIILLMLLLQINKVSKSEILLLCQKQKNNAEIYELISRQHDKLEETRQIEQSRIARDLHDGVMNKLTSTRLNLYILNKHKDIATIDRCLPYIAGLQDIEKEIRLIAHNLNSSSFQSINSFRLALSNLLEDFSSTTILKCFFEIDDSIDWDILNIDKKVHIYRILQEILQNAFRHSHAINLIVSISFEKENNIVLIEVSDDGIGFNEPETQGLGLSNIKLRVMSLTGTIHISKSIGTKILISFPLIN